MTLLTEYYVLRTIRSKCRWTGRVMNPATVSMARQSVCSTASSPLPNMYMMSFRY